MSTEKLKIAKQSAMSELSYVSYLNFFLFENEVFVAGNVSKVP